MGSQLVGRTACFLALVLAACCLLSACWRGGAAAAAVDCLPMAGVPEAPLLLFGEVHGSREAPALVGAVACAASEARAVAVGLEMPSRDQPLLDRFMASTGAPGDVQALLASEFWQRGRDGRSSRAMLELIGDLRALKQAGRPVDLFAFDDQPGTGLERNAAIANGVRRFRKAHPDTRIVALMGSLHAAQESIWSGGNRLTTSAILLADLQPVSVRITYPGGTVWACMPTCGIHALPPSSGETAPGFHADAAPGGDSRTYRLPSLTASPPAAERKKPAP